MPWLANRIEMCIRDRYRCPPEELCKKYPLKKYSWKEKKTIAKSFVIGTTTQQEVRDILVVDIAGRANPVSYTHLIN